MKKLILDVDTGIDDAMALAYSTGTKEIELIGVVGTYGNVNISQAVQNSLNILGMIGKTDVPVYEGASHAMSKSSFTPSEAGKKIHGQNGVGGVDLPQAERTKENESGIDFIINSVKKYGKDLVIAATGSMTNLGIVLKNYPEMAKEIGQIVIMGGSFDSPR